MTAAVVDSAPKTGDGTDVVPLSTSQRFSLLAYAGTPILIGNFAAPYWGVLALPITFFLKNRLHLDANQTARFPADRRHPAVPWVSCSALSAIGGARSARATAGTWWCSAC